MASYSHSAFSTSIKRLAKELLMRENFHLTPLLKPGHLEQLYEYADTLSDANLEHNMALLAFILKDFGADYKLSIDRETSHSISKICEPLSNALNALDEFPSKVTSTLRDILMKKLRFALRTQIDLVCQLEKRR